MKGLCPIVIFACVLALSSGNPLSFLGGENQGKVGNKGNDFPDAALVEINDWYIRQAAKEKAKDLERDHAKDFRKHPVFRILSKLFGVRTTLKKIIDDAGTDKKVERQELRPLRRDIIGLITSVLGAVPDIDGVIENLFDQPADDQDSSDSAVSAGSDAADDDSDDDSDDDVDDDDDDDDDVSLKKVLKSLIGLFHKAWKHGKVSVKDLKKLNRLVSRAFEHILNGDDDDDDDETDLKVVLLNLMNVQESLRDVINGAVSGEVGSADLQPLGEIFPEYMEDQLNDLIGAKPEAQSVYDEFLDTKEDIKADIESDGAVQVSELEKLMGLIGDLYGIIKAQDKDVDDYLSDGSEIDGDSFAGDLPVGSEIPPDTPEEVN